MADQQTNQMLSLDQLGKNARDNLLKAGQEGESALKRELSRQNVSPEFWTEATKIFLTPSASPQSLPGDNFAKNTIGSLGASALAMATRDTSGSSEIMGEVNRTHIDELFGEGGPLYDAYERGDAEGIEEKLKELDPNNLIKTQFSQLESFLERNNIDTKELKQRHEKLLNERDNPKYKKRFEQQQKKTQQVRVDFLNRLKKAKTLEEKQSLLRNYVHLQHNQNSYHFNQLLSTRGGFLGLGRKSTLPKNLKKEIIKNIRSTDKQRNKRLKANKAQQRSSITDPEQNSQELEDFETPPTSYRTFSEQSPSETSSTIVTQPQSMPRNPHIPNPRGRLGNEAESALGKQALKSAITPLLPYIGIALLVLLIFIILVVVIINNSGGSVPLAQIRCGNQDIASIPNLTGTLLEKFMHDDYRIKMKGDSKNAGVSEAAEEGLFNAVCILFSPPNGFKSGTPAFLQPYSTFGNLVVGFPLERDDRSKTKNVEIDLKFGVKGKSCGYEINDPKQLTSGNKLVWNFNNPDTCSDTQLQFLTAEMLGHSLIYQQAYLQHNIETGAYKAFKNTPDSAGIVGQDGLLPTPDCQQGNDYVGVHFDFQQQQDCFADMVGLYLTYALPDASTLSTTDPSNFPTKYFNYYNFAKNNLFDGLDIFISSNKSPGTPLSGPPTVCSGKVVNFSEVTYKELLPLCSGGKCYGRANYCMAPHYIVIHTTWSNDPDATSLYKYFASGSDGRGVGINFGIGPKGDIVQMAETLTSQVEVAWNVLNYQDDIGIELVHPGDYSNTDLPPHAQYSSLVNLVLELMNQYNIPIGDTTVNGIVYDCNWKSNTLNRVFAPEGIYGHYQFNTPTRSDPGQSFLCYFKNDINKMLAGSKKKQSLN